MTLLWRREFTDPELNSYRLMMKASGTKLVQKCDICPCENGWYIVTYCPCDSCVNHEPIFIGEMVLDDGEPVTAEWGSGQDTYELRALEIAAYPLSCGTDGLTESGGWGQTTTVKGAILWAIKHLTKAAPFNCGSGGGGGYVQASVFIDGEGITDWTGTIAEDEQMYIGDGVAGESISTELLEVGHAFADAGVHVVDLRVNFVGNADGEEDAYTVRHAINVCSPSTDSPAVGTVDIVKGKELFDDCGSVVFYTDYYGSLMRMGHAVLKGPFDTYDDANFVYTTWKTLIDHYAASCACERHNCDVGHVLGFNYWSDNPVAINGNYYWMYEGYGGVDDPHTGSGCDYGYIEYEVTKKGSYVVLMRHYDGGYTGETVPTSGILKPCEWFSAFSTEKPDPDDPDFDDKWGFAGDHWIAGTPDEECKFCYGPKSDWVSDPTKSECVYLLNTGPGTPAAYFSDWGYTMTDAENGDGDPHGIPENSEHLRDYTESFVV